MKAKPRFAILAAIAAALLLLPATAAQASVTITLTGPGSGTVTSNTGSPTINCTLSGGITSGTCTNDPPADFFSVTSLTATPAKDWVFGGWTVGAEACTGLTTPCNLNTHFGSSYSLTASFVPPPPKPSAATDPADGIVDTHGVMHGRVNPEGTPLTSCKFEYGISEDYGATMPCTPSAAAIGSGTSEVAVSAQTEEVEPGTTYHYRLLTANVGGTSVGVDRTFTTTGTPPCPNADIRLAQGINTILLPECMALEMVSPPKKFNQAANLPVGISASGERVAFNSTAALAETPTHLNAFGTTYVSTRRPDSLGWETASASPPDPSVFGGLLPIAKSFSPDFSRWVHVPLVFSDQAPLGIGQVFLGGLGGLYARLSPSLVPTPFPSGINPSSFASATMFQAASADHSHVYFRPGQLGFSFLAGDPIPAGSGATFNAYAAQLDPSGNPSLELVARDGDNKVWGGKCGARIGGIEGTNGKRNQGAVSADGTRVYFSTRPTQPEGVNCATATNKLRLMQRLETPDGPWIKELVKSECVRVAPVCNTTNGDDFYQGASVDGTKVYFTTTRQLANSDLDTGTACSATLAQSAGCDLYLYDTSEPVGQRLTQVSAGELVPGVNPGDPPVHAVGSGANVLNGITAISGDGSRVYFVAKGRLTNTPGPKGNHPTIGQPNLYGWDAESGETALIGTLVSSDAGVVWENGRGTFRNRAYPVPVTGTNGKGEEIGGDGHVLLFQSNAPLTSDDGEASFLDVFRYDAEATPPTLVRVSKAMPGGSDDGAFAVDQVVPFETVPPGTDLAEAGRWVSEEGSFVLFQTSEGLIPGDDDGSLDSYLWRKGNLSRLPDEPHLSPTSPPEPQLSHDGFVVAFETAAQLLPQDGDSVKDIYVARAGGGFPIVVESAPCPPDAGEGCQGSAADAPSSSQPASAAFSGTGNVKPEGQSRRCPKGKRVVRRAGKARCVGKKQVQRKKKAHRQQRAGREQGGQK